MPNDVGVLPSLALDGVGTLEDIINPRIGYYAALHGIEEEFFAVGGTNYDRGALQHHVPYGFQNAVELRLNPDDVRENGGFNGDRQFALDRFDSWAPQNKRVNDTHAAAAYAAGSDNPFSVWTYSLTAGHVVVNCDRLEGLTTLVKHERRFGVTAIPHEKFLRDRLAEDFYLYLPAQFRRKRQLEVTNMVDNLSVLATSSKDGREFQIELLAFGIAQMLAAHSHLFGQKNASDYARALGRYGPLCTMGWGTRRLLPGSEADLFGLLRRSFRREAHGYGIPQDVIDRSTEAAFDALENPDWRGIEGEVPRDKQVICLISSPLYGHPKSEKDARVRQRIRAAIEHNINIVWPNVLVQHLHCNGVPQRGFEHLSPIWTTATAVWPITSIPIPIQRIIATVPALPDEQADEIGEGQPPVAHEPRLRIEEIPATANNQAGGIESC